MGRRQLHINANDVTGRVLRPESTVDFEKLVHA